MTELTSSRTVPLERLEVTKDETKSQGESGIPKPPKKQTPLISFAIIADSAAEGGVPESVEKSIESIVNKVDLQLVIHAGD